MSEEEGPEGPPPLHMGFLQFLFEMSNNRNLTSPVGYLPRVQHVVRVGVRVELLKFVDEALELSRAEL
jgi:hypothetical protein